MEKIRLLDLDFEPYILREDIERATARVAAQITADYEGRSEAPILLITLSGAMLWASQLIQQLAIHTEWGFVKCGSYGSSLESCGCVDLQVAPTLDFAGRDVIVVEDVVDSGNTWEFLHKHLTDRGAATVRIATMAFKPTAYKKGLPVNYAALETSAKFIVGNGLDYNQYGRQLANIYVLCE